MAARGDVGVVIDTSRVPVREEGMTPYEILLSESQERMLVVAHRGREGDVRAILEKWDLAAEVIGEVIAEPVYRITEGDTVVAEFPGSRLVTDCPVYHPEARESEEIQRLRSTDVQAVAALPEEADPLWTLERLLASPTIASKAWVYRQYDTMVRTNTVIGPGGDAAVVRLRGTNKALALKTDCNGRYVYLEPRTGGRIAVAEAARNVACAGGRPMAITNCLNFGNPKRPEVFFQFREAVGGMGDACRALGTPVTGGNVSLYNESPGGSIAPTPEIGVVGLLDDIATLVGPAFTAEGDSIVLAGESGPGLAGSEYARLAGAAAEDDPPSLDLEREAALQAFVREAIARGLVASAQDVSGGGLAVSLAECAIWSGLGARIRLPVANSPAVEMFGESPSRVVLTTRPRHAPALELLARQHGLPVETIGTVGGSRVVIRLAGAGATGAAEERGGDVADELDVAVDDLCHAWDHGLERALGWAPEVHS
jgi:phosphoribosylformylglycinamidine synthase II